MNWDDIIDKPGVRLLGFDPGVSIPLPKRHEWSEPDELDGVLVLSCNGERIDLALATDPSDGYRSELAPVSMISAERAILQFANDQIPVTVSQWNGRRDEWSSYESDGWRVVGDDGHVWLDFGTEGVDGYYPCSYVKWNPKEPSE